MQRRLALHPGHHVSLAAGPLLLQVHSGPLLAAGGEAGPLPAAVGGGAGPVPAGSAWFAAAAWPTGTGLVWFGVSHRAATFQPGKRGSSSGWSLVSWRMTTWGFWSAIRLSSSVRRVARLLQFSCIIVSPPGSTCSPLRACRPRLLVSVRLAVVVVGAGGRVLVGEGRRVGLSVSGSASVARAGPGRSSPRAPGSAAGPGGRGATALRRMVPRPPVGGGSGGPAPRTPVAAAGGPGWGGALPPRPPMAPAGGLGGWRWGPSAGRLWRVAAGRLSHLGQVQVAPLRARRRRSAGLSPAHLPWCHIVHRWQRTELFPTFRPHFPQGYTAGPGFISTSPALSSSEAR